MKRSNISRWPVEVRNALDKRLVENNFSNYDALSNEFYAKGYFIGKSSIHRYGQELEKRMQLARAQDQLIALGVNADTAAELTGDSTLVVVIDRRNSRARLISLPATAPEVIDYIKRMGKA